MNFGKALELATEYATSDAARKAVELYGPRIKTASAIRQITDSGTPYNLYAMNVQYPYDLDRLIGRGLGDDQGCIDAIEEVLNGAPAGENPRETAWRALRAASQEPNPEDVTSNTQWSIVFDNKNLTAQVALRRRWDDVHSADIHGAVS